MTARILTLPALTARLSSAAAKEPEFTSLFGVTASPKKKRFERGKREFTLPVAVQRDGQNDNVSRRCQS